VSFNFVVRGAEGFFEGNLWGPEGGLGKKGGGTPPIFQARGNREKIFKNFIPTTPTRAGGGGGGAGPPSTPPEAHPCFHDCWGGAPRALCFF